MRGGWNWLRIVSTGRLWFHRCWYFGLYYWELIYVNVRTFIKHLIIIFVGCTFWMSDEVALLRFLYANKPLSWFLWRTSNRRAAAGCRSNSRQPTRRPVLWGVQTSRRIHTHILPIFFTFGLFRYQPGTSPVWSYLVTPNFIRPRNLTVPS
jgi:hypothetical protein